MLVMLVDACELVRQAKKPKKGPKAHKSSVVLLMKAGMVSITC